MWKWIGLGLSVLMITSSLYAQPPSYWLAKEREAKAHSWEKLQKEIDICDICGKTDKSNKMYKAQKYGVSFYEGEFVRIHTNCMTPDYFVIEAPPGKSKFDLNTWFENKVRMERIEIARLFPFLDILDELIDWTASVTFYKVKNKNNQKTYELYKWLGTWQTREKQKNGKYKFLGEPR